MSSRKFQTAHFESETLHGLPEIMNDMDAVFFDCYGTLVEIKQQRQPYRPFISRLPSASHKEFRDRLMGEDRPIKNWPTVIDVSVPEATITRLEVDIDSEVKSVSRRPAAIRVWRKLRVTGVKLAQCSNAASPYGPAALACMPDQPDHAVFSYKVGSLKPENEIYAAVCEGLNMPAERILFVGDTHSADVAGPQAYGFRSCYIGTFENHSIWNDGKLTTEPTAPDFPHTLGLQIRQKNVLAEHFS